ncbi:uncharacterized protein ASCRUDRAFT_69672 [Ascoidea rubescens DSM 1968]|uniref:Ketopantoate reductase C-terminal domain-containing protein n=1 Tax=Ascoidea rubescens DSM 1968 TaxID=1344418 RepID=A0A1D2VK09_9ASCO|nr:hypothetical protein ASCRUDRAFT_69672 [Ascoidea rubescens DSM 1968]ODV61961.1 hypothetical protein ASCRUDRAFT_69672 [Ascoidea rubescens DSM 1968]
MVYILGTNSINNLLATSLVPVLKTGVVLLFGKEFIYNSFRESQSTITMNSKNYKFDNCFVYNKLSEIEKFNKKRYKKATIDNIIISGTDSQISEYLNYYKSFLNNESNVFLVRSGLGIDSILAIHQIFIKEKSPLPNFYHVTTNHLIEKTEESDHSYQHVGIGHLKLSKIPNKYFNIVFKTFFKSKTIGVDSYNLGIQKKTTGTIDNVHKENQILTKDLKPFFNLEDSDEKEDSIINGSSGSNGDNSNENVLEDLKKTNLKPIYLENYYEFAGSMLEKLIISSIIEPLSVLINCTNGELLGNNYAISLIHQLLSEDLLLLEKGGELFRSEIPNYSNIFNHERIFYVIMSILNSNKYGSTNMRKNFNQTEFVDIDQLNGIFIRILGTKHAPKNEMVLKLLKSKMNVTKYRK